MIPGVSQITDIVDLVTLVSVFDFLGPFDPVYQWGWLMSEVTTTVIGPTISQLYDRSRKDQWK